MFPFSEITDCKSINEAIVYLTSNSSLYEFKDGKKVKILYCIQKYFVIEEKVWIVKSKFVDNKIVESKIFLNILARNGSNWSFCCISEGSMSVKNPYFLDCPLGFFDDVKENNKKWREACYNRQRYGLKLTKGQILKIPACEEQVLKVYKIYNDYVIAKDSLSNNVKISKNLIPFMV